MLLGLGWALARPSELRAAAAAAIDAARRGPAMVRGLAKAGVSRASDRRALESFLPPRAPPFFLGCSL
eukprot:4068180-Pyramimonas_sp.AAC.1